MLQKVFVADLDPQRQAQARERAAANGQLGGNGLTDPGNDVRSP
jgi:hypothetical protein